MATVPKTLRVVEGPMGQFEIRDQDQLLGTSRTELIALWSAVSLAEQLAKFGFVVRVISYKNGEPIEQFVAKSSQSR